MMKKIVYLPLDERPCNYAFPAFLLEDNPDYTLIRPTEDMLGRKKTPADFEKLSVFLKEQCKTAYGLVLSVDMLLYGGIVPSRLHYFDEAELNRRLSLLKTLKAENPALKIYAFSLIMRCPCYSSSDEEPDYYETSGREIFLNGQNEHKYALGVIDEATYREERAKLAPKIEGCLQDFLSRRSVNIKALENTLYMLGKEIDKFVIPQDDSSPYGYTAIDQARVKAYIKDNALPEVDIYPGADEVGMTLLSALIVDDKKSQPKICPVYPHEDCKKVIPLYEDRAVERSIASQIKNAGGILTEDETEADILLFCNLPVGPMKNYTEQFGEQYDRRNLDLYVAKMQTAIQNGKTVASADIAYCNGGDLDWTKKIDKAFGLFALGGYAGWNTSSNTLGTVICQSVLYHYYGDTATHRRFTAERIYEDIAYCSYARKYICDNVLPDMGLDYFHADGRVGKVSEIVKETLNAYVRENYPTVYNGYAITACEMPWSRMFEVGLTVKERKK